MACVMNRALSLFCSLSCMAHCTCFIANCMRLCFIYVNRWHGLQCDLMAVQNPMTLVRAFSSQSGCILMSACCARLGRVRPYRFWLGRWPLRPRMLSTPAGSEGRRKRGVSLLCAFCLCVAFTHRHMGGMCVCASVSSGPSVSRCPIWSGLGSAGLGCVSCG